MGIQINGQTDIISATDGALNVSGASLGSASASSLNIIGIVTASGFTGNVTGNLVGNVNATGLSTFSGGIRVGATTSITVGQSFIRNNAVGLGQTDTTGRNAGVGTAVGTLIYNTTTDYLEIYKADNTWESIVSAFSATGGTISIENGYITHTFTTSSSFIVLSGKQNIEVEVLGGGGSGSSGSFQWAGGGGGGGYAYASRSISPGTYSITVGVGATRQSSCGSNGNNGVSSTAFGFTGFGGNGGINGASPTSGGGFSIPGGVDLGSSAGQNGFGSNGDGSGGGGNNGKRVANPSFTTWGGGAAGVPNGTPGNNASGYGNGGSGGHSCQGGHNGGGSGSPGIVIVKYSI
jgi:hypothetical protein